LRDPESPPRSRLTGARHWFRTLRTAFWLGWQIESNWTDPFLFFVYQMARPLGAALILVFMYRVVAGGQPGPLLAFFVVGSAFWGFVVSGMQGMTWSLIGDREHWRTLRYVYTSPISFRAYLVGRALAQAASASAAAVVTLLFAHHALGVPLHLLGINFPYATASLVLGICAITALGLLVAAGAMMISGEAWRMPEGVGAALYLVCGAIFPIGVLPGFLQSVAHALPLTWWLEAMRRGLLGHNVVHSFPWASDGLVLAILSGLTALYALGAATIFRLGEHRARILGILDRETGY
jgi:ABC-2 type transport system permease protein